MAEKLQRKTNKEGERKRKKEREKETAWRGGCAYFIFSILGGVWSPELKMTQLWPTDLCVIEASLGYTASSRTNKAIK